MNIIPAPQKIDYISSGILELKKIKSTIISGLPLESFELIKNSFPEASMKNSDSYFSLRMMISQSDDIPIVKVPAKNDAYVLCVTADWIAIDANDHSGLWFGIQTLIQMIEEKDLIPVCEIYDYAAIRQRGVHWDLKGCQPKFPVLLEEFRRLAKYKVNLVLLELEDKYQFKNTPDVGCESAYSFEQMRTLSRHAVALGITIVPKLQCLGHVDYLLKLERYKHLRESVHPYQYCPRSEDVFELWKTMADELMECFAEHKEFFHIGADETDKLGVCPKCAKYSKVDSYMFHVNRCMDFVIEHGYSPVMWDDIIRNAHNELDPQEAEQAMKLSEKAIINYWAYGYGGKKNIFPALSSYQKQGARVWGASGFSGCDNWAGSLPPLEIRAKNIDAWAKTAVENDLDTIIATGWTRIASATPPTEPHETSWFVILYAANSMWSGKICDYKDFIDTLSQQLYSCCLSKALVNAILNINNHPFLLADIDSTFDKNPSLALLQYAAASESFSINLNSMVACRRMFHGRIGKETTDYVIKGRHNALNKFKDELADLEEKTKKYLSCFYESETVDDYILTRFGYCHEYAEEFLKWLDYSKLL